MTGYTAKSDNIIKYVNNNLHIQWHKIQGDEKTGYWST